MRCELTPRYHLFPFDIRGVKQIFNIRNGEVNKMTRYYLFQFDFRRGKPD